MGQRTVDVHCHWYPMEYMEYLISRGKEKTPYCVHDGGTHYRMYFKGVPVAHIDRAGHYDLEARVRDLDAAGLDTQLLTVTIPGSGDVREGCGCLLGEKDAMTILRRPRGNIRDVSITWHRCRIRIRMQRAKSLERCKKMGAVGIQMFSNFNGEAVFLEKFHPIYEIADKYDLPFLVHPAVPLTASVMDMMKLPYQLWGYTLDTSMAVMSMIFQGVLAKYPKTDPCPWPPRRHGSLFRPQNTGCL